MALIGVNGGLIGPSRVPDNLSATGIWTPDAQIQLRRGGSWPLAQTPFSNVSLLLHFNGANNSTTFTDSSTNAFTVTRFGNTVISTAQSKFGGASALFDGSGDYLEIAGNSAFQFPGDFTVEYHARPSVITLNKTIIEIGLFTDGILMRSAAETNFDYAYVNTVQPTYNFPGRLNSNVWYHAALTRAGTDVRYFINGIQVGPPATVSGTVNSASAAVRIGRNRHTSTDDYNGYIDELRITKGFARYTANFTPPTAAFPDA
jgi:hypothetical protein